MNFPSPLVKGALIKRYRRNLADVRLDSGQDVTAHVFHTGPMAGCDSPGSTVFLSDSGDRSRKNHLTWELVEVNGVLVGVNPKIAKHALLEAIVNDEIEALRGYRLNEGAISGPGGSNDILLESMDDNCLLSYHIVLRVEGGVGFIPEETGASSVKQLDRLASFARSGHRAVAFYHVLRGDCTEVRPAFPNKKEYRTMIEQALRAGVEMLVFRADVTTAGISVGSPVPFLMS